MFDAHSDRYDSWYARNPITAANELKTVMALGLRGRGLEVGVGTGWFASRLGVEYGIDPSRGMLRYARLRGVEVVEGVGEYLPFRRGVFDYVLAIVTLCFAEDPFLLVLEARRVLRRGGVFASCIVPRDSVWGQYYLDLKRRGHVFYSVAEFYSLEEVYEMYRQAGFTSMRHISSLFYTPFDNPVEEEPVWGARGGFTCVMGYRD